MLSRDPDPEADAVLITEMLDFGSLEGGVLEWEAEADVLEPEDDRHFRLRLESIQREITSHKPRDNGKEWKTVEFQVPRLLHARWVEAPSVSRLVRVALAMGRVSTLEVESACIADFCEEAEHVLPRLIQLLQDVGVCLDEVLLWETVANPRLESGHEWLVEEVLQGLADSLPAIPRAGYWQKIRATEGATFYRGFSDVSAFMNDARFGFCCTLSAQPVYE
ncbi:hypothetical protein [Cupriavidus gilardii]|uniref:Uncharacterized protein n=1 Tax=Cupriavidus gilardii TaxID=82541 RepID=A0ABY4VU26_9BURK|nr:hypothetical protein [Cupriavidus gilardii]USE80463.1 hypothetical protein NDR89_11835 [Cupriavidus gilardii]UXC36333.1 hypothetical protein N4G38_02330 [Cupriavidus gilardii]